MTTLTGGSAYPFFKLADVYSWQSAEIHGGLTIRDHFAAKALPVILGKLPLDGLLSESFPEEETKLIAEASYKFADAMIQAREVSNV